MINPPDDLLEDLQAALPPEFQVPTPEPPRPSSGQANGHDHLEHYYDRTSPRTSHERASVASTSKVRMVVQGGRGF